MLGKIFRDPIYEYITVSKQELHLIDSPWFQRLRHCSQNGPARLVYPSLLGTRFEHSLGVMELGERVLQSALDKDKHYKPAVIDRFLEQCQRDFAAFLGHDVAASEVQECLSKVLRMACLCHDLGHFPLSHTFEMAFEQKFWLDAVPNYWIKKRACHEAISAEVLRQLAYEHEPAIMDDWIARGAILVLMNPPDVVASHNDHSIPLHESIFSALSSILIGDYDVDRLDYLQRDGRISGAGFGAIDLERLVKSMMLVEDGNRFEVMPTSKALSSVETTLLERYKEYKWVVFHHKVVFYNEITVEISRDILSAPNTIKGLFRRVCDDVPAADGYRDEVLRKLGDPDEEVPPLNVYDGELLGLEPGGYVLNAEFFVNNDDTHLLDDIWFSLKCRSLCRAEPEEGKFYLQALVDRCKCGLTLWKDLSQFRTFQNECIGAANANDDLVNKANLLAQDRFHELATAWIRRLWARMQEEEGFGEKAFDVVSHAMDAEFSARSQAGVRFLLAPARWSKLFGKLANKQVLGRRNVPVSLLANSNLLKNLAGLEGEIPLFVYACGEKDQIERLEADVPDETLRLQTAAKGLINGLVTCWDDPSTPEPRGACLEVSKSGQ
ncbi:MAG: HD domain-containing protein [Phycisphaerales bacterium]|nr:HD domain-containing protein [Phycisphaerales bacterium]